jgi:hypothetical protein
MSRRGTFTPFNTDDEYMTPTYAFRDFFSYVNIDKEQYTLWEPFYGDGRSSEIMEGFGFDVIRCQGKDFFLTPPPEGDNIIMVTNPPFSTKKEVLRYVLEVYNIQRFAILLPSQTFYAKYFQKMLSGDRKITMLVPPARVQFVKNGVKTRCNALDTAWMVSGLPLPEPPHGIHYLPEIGPRDA